MNLEETRYWMNRYHDKWIEAHNQLQKQEDCAAERCAEEIRKQRHLPPRAGVAVYISCPCPRCKSWHF